MSIGIIGHGYVGGAIDSFFQGVEPVMIFDVKKPELNRLEDVVQCDIVFVAVPTPSAPDGSCDTTIVEEVFSRITDIGRNIGRIHFNSKMHEFCEFVTVLKSTVPPGFTTSMAQKFPLRLVFSPEFLTERNSIKDYAQAHHVIAAGSVCDCQIYLDHMRNAFKARRHKPLFATVEKYETAEMAKLFVNTMLATKVAMANEIQRICQKLSIDYGLVSYLGTLDWRVGQSHVDVPGPDGQLGFGGSCFPKDLGNLRYIAKMVGSGEKILSAIIERNNEIRGSE
jgi:nucleotide sugar dehydrogenase